MQVLALASAESLAHATWVSARWKTVDVRLDSDPLSEASDCELLEQVKQNLLPLFTTRAIEYHSSCIPHQVQPNGTRLRVEVLMADPPDAKRAVPKP